MVCTLFVLSNYKGAKSLKLADLTMLRSLSGLGLQPAQQWIGSWSDVPQLQVTVVALVP